MSTDDLVERLARELARLEAPNLAPIHFECFADSYRRKAQLILDDLGVPALLAKLEKLRDEVERLRQNYEDAHVDRLARTLERDRTIDEREYLKAEVTRLGAEVAALDNRWLEGCCEHRDPESVDLWRGTPCPTCAEAVGEVESSVTIEAREAATPAVLGAFHELHPRIPGIVVGDCHCNLLAEVALTALVEAGFVIRPATPRSTGEDT